jgi:formate hydrogenlyase transcriptional activator
MRLSGGVSLQALPEFLSEALSLIPDKDLSQVESLLSLYFNSSTLGFCILDTEFRYLAVNAALATMNGLSPAEHVGRAIYQVLGPLADQIDPELRQLLTTGTPQLDIHVSGVLPNRSETGHWIRHFFPIQYRNGRVTRIAGIILEVTRQKQMEATVSHLSKGMKLQMDRMQMLLDVGSILAANWNVGQVFPKISARIRRVLRHEYAGFSVHDSSTGTLVRQAEDFPLGKGPTAEVLINASNSPGARSLEKRSAMIFSKEQMQAFDAEIARRFLAEGLRSLCCVPLLRPQGPLGVLVLGSTRSNAFHAEDLSLLSQVAGQLGIALENSRAAVEIEQLKKRLNEERKYLEEGSHSQGDFGEIIGESVALKKVLDQVATVALSDATVLILGETGTGKELIAHAIHRLSRRKDRNFVKVNCAAIPTGLLESELFGHEKGAFTGAVSQKVGRIELADGGTLFLDEVGEIPLELQPKLLRVLQDQEFERLGSTRTIRVQVRILAATNRDLARSVAEHLFRNDLFYRLNVFPICVPPLRERPEDIPLLVRHFVRKFARRMDRHIESIPKESMAVLTRWSWPGNVRELENLMERSVILSPGPALHVPIAELHTAVGGSHSPSDDSLSEAEREHIVRVLRETGGVLSGPSGAAQRLGLKRTTLQSKMSRLGITRQEYVGRPNKKS